MKPSRKRSRTRPSSPCSPCYREAFAHYRQAANEIDFDTRARLMFFGNLKCGWHEQTRLQPEIASAMKAPLATLNDLTRRFVPFLRRPVARFTTLIQDLTCRDRHARLHVLEVPDGTRLQLGRDLGRTIPQCFDAIERDPLLAQFKTRGAAAKARKTGPISRSACDT